MDAWERMSVIRLNSSIRIDKGANVQMFGLLIKVWLTYHGFCMRRRLWHHETHGRIQELQCLFHRLHTSEMVRLIHVWREELVGSRVLGERWLTAHARDTGTMAWMTTTAVQMIIRICLGKR